MKKINIFVGVALLFMLLALIFSARGDSAIMDELAHIPAGFGYVTQHDYRLNPEHPTLLKAMAAYSARIFAHPRFPTDTKFWQDEVNGQWSQGDIFLYGSGNDAEKIIFWSRFPLILLTVFFAGLFFWWTKKKFGNIAAVFSFLFFALSPTILTHGRFVTTDVGAAFGFFLGAIVFIRFLGNPNWRNVFFLGVTLGAIELLKFSLILIIPMFAIVLFLWSWSFPYLNLAERLKKFTSMALKTCLAGILGILIIWAVYFYFGYNTALSKQVSDSQTILESSSSRRLIDLNLWLAGNELTRPLGQYMLGVMMVSQRASSGNTGYFLGKVSNSGWYSYFPLLYLYKEPLPLHIFTLIALVFAGWRTIKSFRKKTPFWARVRSWIFRHPEETFALTAIVIYWGSSISSPLNIGVRHVLPTFPFVYFLVFRQVRDWLKYNSSSSFPGSVWGAVVNVYKSYIKSLPRYFVAFLLAVWLIIGTARVFPDFMSFYNELAGGPENGYKIAVDSNYDWGQDLKRLTDFTDENKIDRINLDYFGGGNPRYYLGDKFIPWDSSKGIASGWFAVSASFREQAFGTSVPGFNRAMEDTYSWLKPHKPVARAGKSIFIYKLP